MRRNTNFTADAAYTEITTCAKPSGDRDSYVATISVYGTFGGGTVTIFMSPDNGTTKIALIDPLTSAAISLTSARAFNIKAGAGSGNAGATDVKLYATLAGSTGANLNITVHDNLG